jgi:hypothetical protein
LLSAPHKHYGSGMRRGLLVAMLALGFAAPAASAPPGIVIQSPIKEVQGFDAFDVFGAVASGRAGENVTVEIKECGSVAPFHHVAGDVTGNAGTWTTKIGLAATSQIRARWRGGVSDSISVQVHPSMRLTYKGPGRYFVWVIANDWFDGRRAVLERAHGTKWVPVKTFTLHRVDSIGAPSSTATVRAHLKRGTTIRAVLAKSEVGHCYLAGISNPFKT